MGNKLGSVLVVDDNEDVLFAVKLLLEQHVAQVTAEPDPNRVPGLLEKNQFDIILLDMNFTRDVTSGREGFELLEHILAGDPEAVVIMITAYADVDMAVKAIKAGATDFVVKPWQNEKLLATVSAALALSRSRKEMMSARSRELRLRSDLDKPYRDFVGESPGIREVRTIIGKVAKTDASVLITGESGTGKELVARAIHRHSKRADKAFISVDVASISGTLFESELFGHVKGAFTDAREDRPGRFELADRGTLLLDEIGNLPLDLQPKLLTVLQSRKVTRVGSNRSIGVDVRTISATNMSLVQLIESGEFREDLLYRINTVEIPIPPLRDRSGDIPLLANHFLEMYARKYRKSLGRPSAAVLQKLSSYHWPGNVRELQHAMERAVIMCSTTFLKPEDFSFSPRAPLRDSSGTDTFNLEALEEMTVRKAMAAFGGNVSKVARELGISRPALYRRLVRYGLV